jgi:aspartate/glutamate racemase
MSESTPKPLVYVVHTSFVSVKDIGELFAEYAPETIVRNIVDDSLLPEVLRNGGVTPAVRERLLEYYRTAERCGADLVFNQCSSVGEVADEGQKLLNVPLVKIDGGMVELACRTGPRIGVVATLETTLGPTSRFVEATARRLGIDIVVTRRLITGAFEQLIGGNRARHNEMVLSAIRELIPEVDVVVCAQGSMAAILPELGETRVPVLTSPRLGVQNAIHTLRSLPDAEPASSHQK